MIYKAVLSPHAEQQLEDLLELIASDSGLDRAEKFVGSIIAYCQGFSTFPKRGTRRDDVRPGMRIVGFRRLASIVFTVEDDSVVFLAIYYGGQDFEDDLRDLTP
ncbi:type II toxin-antitoxin system RelE/ParE family toxin [Rhizobium sp.]